MIVNLMMVFHDRNTTEYGGGAISVLYQFRCVYLVGALFTNIAR